MPSFEYDQIDNWFTYHAPSAEDLEHYKAIRDSAKQFALAISNHCPRSADATAAMRLLREAVMTANASIACGGK